MGRIGIGTKVGCRIRRIGRVREVLYEDGLVLDWDDLDVRS